MDAELRRAKMEELLPRLQEAVRLNQAEHWAEGKALLLNLHNESMAWGGSAFVAWHLAVAADGCGDFALALHAIRWALDADPFPPPFRASYDTIVRRVRAALAALLPESPDVPRLHALLVRYAEPNAQAHVALAEHFLSLNAVEAAGRAVDEALALDPSSIDAWLVRAAIARRRGTTGDATDAEAVAAQLEAHLLGTSAAKAEA